MSLVSGPLADCLVGCHDVLPPSGLDQLLVGVLGTGVALLPGVILHRFLRRRGR